MLFITLYAFLIISLHKILNFRLFSQKHYIQTDRRTDGHTLLQRCKDASKKIKRSQYVVVPQVIIPYRAAAQKQGPAANDASSCIEGHGSSLAYLIHKRNFGHFLMAPPPPQSLAASVSPPHPINLLTSSITNMEAPGNQVSVYYLLKKQGL